MCLKWKNTCGGNDLLSHGDLVVLEKNHFQLVADVTVRVDDGGNAVEQLDDLLGHVVTGSSFATYLQKNNYYQAFSIVGAYLLLGLILYKDYFSKIKNEYVYKIYLIHIIFDDNILLSQWSNWRTHHDGPGDDGLVLRVWLDTVVKRNSEQDVQQLTLVLVDALHLESLGEKRILEN